MTTATKATYKNAADILAEKGEVFGLPLEENVPYVIHDWSTRPQHFEASNGREARDGVQITLNMSLVAGSDEVKDYRCFSAVLLRQLNSIGKDNLPMVARFVRNPTLDGRTDENGKRFAAWAIAVA
jgi:hypothetical protein